MDDLQAYNSLTDPHLQSYFASERRRRELQRAGLITECGEVVTEATYRLNAFSRNPSPRRRNEMPAIGAIFRTQLDDFERVRQQGGDPKKKMTDLIKAELVQYVRTRECSRSRSNLASNGREVKSNGQDNISNGVSHDYQPAEIEHHPKQKRRQPQQQQEQYKEPVQQRQPMLVREKTHNTLLSCNEGSRTADSGVTLPTTASGRRLPIVIEQRSMWDYATLYHSIEQWPTVAAGPRHSPQPPPPPMMSLPPLSPTGITPKLLQQSTLSQRSPRSSRKKNRIQVEVTDSQGQPIKERNKNKRAESPVRPPVDSAPSVKPPATASSTAPSSQRERERTTLKPHPCDITLSYIGATFGINLSLFDPTDDVMIEQQHCGGNAVIVYRERIKPGADMQFTSRRHVEFPFSLTFYVNGRQDCRLSACCEYRYKTGSRIGGKSGHFKITKVDGGLMCPRCTLEESVLDKKDSSNKRSRQTDASDISREPTDIKETKKMCHQKEESLTKSPHIGVVSASKQKGKSIATSHHDVSVVSTPEKAVSPEKKRRKKTTAQLIKPQLLLMEKGSSDVDNTQKLQENKPNAVKSNLVPSAKNDKKEIKHTKKDAAQNNPAINGQDNKSEKAVKEKVVSMPEKVMNDGYEDDFEEDVDDQAKDKTTDNDYLYINSGEEVVYLYDCEREVSRTDAEVNTDLSISNDSQPNINAHKVQNEIAGSCEEKIVRSQSNKSMSESQRTEEDITDKMNDNKSEVVPQLHMAENTVPDKTPEAAVVDQNGQPSYSLIEQQSSDAVANVSVYMYMGGQEADTMEATISDVDNSIALAIESGSSVELETELKHSESIDLNLSPVMSSTDRDVVSSEIDSEASDMLVDKDSLNKNIKIENLVVTSIAVSVSCSSSIKTGVVEGLILSEDGHRRQTNASPMKAVQDPDAIHVSPVAMIAQEFSGQEQVADLEEAEDNESESTHGQQEIDLGLESKLLLVEQLISDIESPMLVNDTPMKVQEQITCQQETQGNVLQENVKNTEQEVQDEEVSEANFEYNLRDNEQNYMDIEARPKDMYEDIRCVVQEAENVVLKPNHIEQELGDNIQKLTETEQHESSEAQELIKKNYQNQVTKQENIETIAEQCLDFVVLKSTDVEQTWEITKTEYKNDEKQLKYVEQEKKDVQLQDADQEPIVVSQTPAYFDLEMAGTDQKFQASEQELPDGQEEYKGLYEESRIISQEASHCDVPEVSSVEQQENDSRVPEVSSVEQQENDSRVQDSHNEEQEATKNEAYQLSESMQQEYEERKQDSLVEEPVAIAKDAYEVAEIVQQEGDEGKQDSATANNAITDKDSNQVSEMMKLEHQKAMQGVQFEEMEAIDANLNQASEVLKKDNDEERQATSNVEHQSVHYGASLASELVQQTNDERKQGPKIEEQEATQNEVHQVSKAMQQQNAKRKRGSLVEEPEARDQDVHEVFEIVPEMKEETPETVNNEIIDNEPIPVFEMLQQDNGEVNQYSQTKELEVTDLNTRQAPEILTKEEKKEMHETPIAEHAAYYDKSLLSAAQQKDDEKKQDDLIVDHEATQSGPHKVSEPMLQENKVGKLDFLVEEPAASDKDIHDAFEIVQTENGEGKQDPATARHENKDKDSNPVPNMKQQEHVVAKQGLQFEELEATDGNLKQESEILNDLEKELSPSAEHEAAHYDASQASKVVEVKYAEEKQDPPSENQELIQNDTHQVSEPIQKESEEERHDHLIQEPEATNKDIQEVLEAVQSEDKEGIQDPATVKKEIHCDSNPVSEVMQQEAGGEKQDLQFKNLKEATDAKSYKLSKIVKQESCGETKEIPITEQEAAHYDASQVAKVVPGGNDERKKDSLTMKQEATQNDTHKVKQEATQNGTHKVSEPIQQDNDGTKQDPLVEKPKATENDVYEVAELIQQENEERQQDLATVKSEITNNDSNPVSVTMPQKNEQGEQHTPFADPETQRANSNRVSQIFKPENDAEMQITSIAEQKVVNCDHLPVVVPQEDDERNTPLLIREYEATTNDVHEASEPMQPENVEENENLLVGEQEAAIKELSLEAVIDILQQEKREGKHDLVIATNEIAVSDSNLASEMIKQQNLELQCQQFKEQDQTSEIVKHKNDEEKQVTPKIIQAAHYDAPQLSESVQGEENETKQCPLIDEQEVLQNDTHQVCEPMQQENNVGKQDLLIVAPVVADKDLHELFESVQQGNEVGNCDPATAKNEVTDIDSNLLCELMQQDKEEHDNKRQDPPMKDQETIQNDRQQASEILQQENEGETQNHLAKEQKATIKDPSDTFEILPAENEVGSHNPRETRNTILNDDSNPASAVMEQNNGDINQVLGIPKEEHSEEMQETRTAEQQAENCDESQVYDVVQHKREEANQDPLAEDQAVIQSDTDHLSEIIGENEGRKQDQKSYANDKDMQLEIVQPENGEGKQDQATEITDNCLNQESNMVQQDNGEAKEDAQIDESAVDIDANQVMIPEIVQQENQQEKHKPQQNQLVQHELQIAKLDAIDTTANQVCDTAQQESDEGKQETTTMEQETTLHNACQVSEETDERKQVPPIEQQEATKNDTVQVSIPAQQNNIDGEQDPLVEKRECIIQNLDEVFEIVRQENGEGQQDQATEITDNCLIQESNMMQQDNGEVKEDPQIDELEAADIDANQVMVSGIVQENQQEKHKPQQNQLVQHELQIAKPEAMDTTANQVCDTVRQENDESKQETTIMEQETALDNAFQLSEVMHEENDERKQVPLIEEQETTKNDTAQVSIPAQQDNIDGEQDPLAEKQECIIQTINEVFDIVQQENGEEKQDPTTETTDSDLNQESKMVQQDNGEVKEDPRIDELEAADIDANQVMVSGIVQENQQDTAQVFIPAQQDNINGEQDPLAKKRECIIQNIDEVFDIVQQENGEGKQDPATETTDSGLNQESKMVQQDNGEVKEDPQIDELEAADIDANLVMVSGIVQENQQEKHKPQQNQLVQHELQIAKPEAMDTTANQVCDTVRQENDESKQETTIMEQETALDNAFQLSEVMHEENDERKQVPLIEEQETTKNDTAQVSIPAQQDNIDGEQDPLAEKQECLIQNIDEVFKIAQLEINHKTQESPAVENEMVDNHSTPASEIMQQDYVKTKSDADNVFEPKQQQNDAAKQDPLVAEIMQPEDKEGQQDLATVKNETTDNDSNPLSEIMSPKTEEFKQYTQFADPEATDMNSSQVADIFKLKNDDGKQAAPIGEQQASHYDVSLEPAAVQQENCKRKPYLLIEEQEVTKNDVDQVPEPMPQENKDGKPDFFFEAQEATIKSLGLNVVDEILQDENEKEKLDPTTTKNENSDYGSNPVSEMIQQQTVEIKQGLQFEKLEAIDANLNKISEIMKIENDEEKPETVFAMQEAAHFDGSQVSELVQQKNDSRKHYPPMEEQRVTENDTDEISEIIPQENDKGNQAIPIAEQEAADLVYQITEVVQQENEVENQGWSIVKQEAAHNVASQSSTLKLEDSSLENVAQHIIEQTREPETTSTQIMNETQQEIQHTHMLGSDTRVGSNDESFETNANYDGTEDTSIEVNNASSAHEKMLTPVVSLDIDNELFIGEANSFEPTPEVNKSAIKSDLICDASMVGAVVGTLADNELMDKDAKLPDAELMSSEISRICQSPEEERGNKVHDCQEPPDDTIQLAMAEKVKFEDDDVVEQEHFGNNLKSLDTKICPRYEHLNETNGEPDVNLAMVLLAKLNAPDEDKEQAQNEPSVIDKQQLNPMQDRVMTYNDEEQNSINKPAYEESSVMDIENNIEINHHESSDTNPKDTNSINDKGRQQHQIPGQVEHAEEVETSAPECSVPSNIEPEQLIRSDEFHVIQNATMLVGDLTLSAETEESLGDKKVHAMYEQVLAVSSLNGHLQSTEDRDTSEFSSEIKTNVIDAVVEPIPMKELETSLDVASHEASVLQSDTFSLADVAVFTPNTNVLNASKNDEVSAANVKAKDFESNKLGVESNGVTLINEIPNGQDLPRSNNTLALAIEIHSVVRSAASISDDILPIEDLAPVSECQPSMASSTVTDLSAEMTINDENQVKSKIVNDFLSVETLGSSPAANALSYDMAPVELNPGDIVKDTFPQAWQGVLAL